MSAAGEMRRVAGVSVGLSALIALALALQRSKGAQPFEVPVYSHLLLFQDYEAILPFIAILLVALVPAVRELGLRAAHACGRHPWPVALATSVLLALGTHAVYHEHPLSMDEHMMLFQSKLFVAGRLSAQFPRELVDWLIPEFFIGRFYRIGPAGEVVSAYWPGFSLLLTPFTALGAPWLLNPLLGGATVLVMHRLGLALLGNAHKAGCVVLLTVASPVVTINALSYYAMPAHLLANAVFALLLLRPTLLRAFLAGVIGSIALTLHNPIPHLLFALPWLVWLAFEPARRRFIGALILGYLPLGALLGWGWAVFVQGDTLAARTASVFSWTSSTGFAVHGLDLCKVWLWAVPGLLAAAAWGAWRKRQESVWLALSGSALLTYFGYFVFAFDQGHGWGYRYFHSAWLVLPLLAAAAWREPQQGEAPALAGYLAGCALLSLVFLTALRAWQVEQFIGRHLAQLPPAVGGEARLLFVNTRAGYYAWDLVQNDPLLRGRLILVSHGARADATLAQKLRPGDSMLGADGRGSAWGKAR